MGDLTFIAGGSKGLGAELVEIFKVRGHHVMEFSRSGSGDHHIYCDFNNSQTTTEIIEQTFASFNPGDFTQINLVINTATLGPFGALANAKPAGVKQHLTINIESTVTLLRLFLAAVQNHQTSKSITYISSGAARRAIPGLAMYSASKAFFERLIDTLAAEQSNETNPIQCMTINPGVMNTDMQAEIRAQDAADFPMVGMWNDLYEQNKLAEPKDIASVCYQLINDEGENGGYYTAQNYLSKS